MAKATRQTFKKRQREMAKRQKREDKAKRIAARRAGPDSEDKPKEDDSVPADEEKKPGLVITVRTGRTRPEPGGK